MSSSNQTAADSKPAAHGLPTGFFNGGWTQRVPARTASSQTGLATETGSSALSAGGVERHGETSVCNGREAGAFSGPSQQTSRDRDMAAVHQKFGADETLWHPRALRVSRTAARSAM